MSVKTALNEQEFFTECLYVYNDLLVVDPTWQHAHIFHLWDEDP